MSQLILDVPDDSLLSLKLSDEAAAAEIRLAASVKLYELGRLSSGAGARLAGIPRTLFLSKLADYGVDTFCLTEDELERQTSLACGYLQYLAAPVPAPDRATGAAAETGLPDHGPDRRCPRAGQGPAPGPRSSHPRGAGVDRPACPVE